MSWKDDIEKSLSTGGKTPTHSEVMKELREEWRQFNHVKQVAEREMAIRKQRFAEVEQDGMKQLGEEFMNENQILWDEPEHE
mgnify:CR=1 FL=1